MTKKSELQIAADRVREIQEAVTDMENNLEVCKADYDKKLLAFQESERNMRDTQDLLYAQRQKLQRELNACSNLVFKGQAVIGFTGVNACAEAKEVRYG